MASTPSDRIVGNTTARTNYSAERSMADKARAERRRRVSFQAGEIRRPGELLADGAERVGGLRGQLLAIGAQIDAEEAEEREARQRRELLELETPSTLLRRVQRDWPEQSSAVRALAAELGVGLAEAWHLVIKAGLQSLGGVEVPAHG